MNDKFRIGRTFISCTNPENAINDITAAAIAGNGGYICVSNMRMIHYANKHPEYNKIMLNSMMNWPDGKPLSWCGKLWGLKDVRCTSGPSTFSRIMTNPDFHLKHYLLGDTQDVLDEIVAKFPQSNIVGSISLPFADVDEFDYQEIAKSIYESGANMIWTAMTAPKQDEFNARLVHFLPNVVAIGVGRAFRLSIGRVKDAPQWAKKAGIGGMFIGRKSKPQLLWWYMKETLVLFGYFISIIWRRLIGKKYYE